MQLTEYWFGTGTADDDILIMADYIAESGWNGNIEHTKAYEANRINAIDRGKAYVIIKYFLSAVFMGADRLQVRYPVLKKHPYILPIIWVRRGFEVCFSRREKLKKVIHAYDNVNVDELTNIDDMRKSFGL